MAAVVIVAVYCVPAVRLATGLNPTEVPLTVTVPATAAPDAVARRTLEVVRVEFVMASENAAVIQELIATPVAELTGTVVMTRGAVELVVDEVVNVQT